MANEGGGAGGAMWAVATLLIVVMVLGTLYFTGVLGGAKKQQIDINVTTPTTK